MAASASEVDMTPEELLGPETHRMKRKNTSEVEQDGRPATQPPTNGFSTPPAAFPPGSDTILSTYKRVPDVDRYMMLEMTQCYLENPQFRAMVARFLSQNPRRPFRFLDLPTEIRSVIARYVLKYDMPLEFRWLTYKPTEKKGTFPGLSRLTALSRTSKQLQAELSSIVWTVNTFQFGITLTLGLNTDTSLRRPTQHEAMEEAIRFFIRNAQPQNLKSVFLSMDTYCYDPTFGPMALKTHIQAISGLVNIIPDAKWKVIDSYWAIMDIRKKLDQRRVERFAEFGKKLAGTFAHDDISSIPRAWKLYPHICGSSIEKTKQKLIAAGVEEASKWIDDGL
ncbi:hypothetical protein BU25DRAFT_454815 [Macroventuria anomochaeta]|uniref:Uncharacterized protein n=1 Tax=Macroventuria anomochaeta TaxID=301207 RepID=A0ACB6SDM8_9PLEO|nr:uncharacterized protein BU25DRAFT_454815 [Macroventuria anomochaeta]KAF2631359.1 hypothetical protein BU25DRAFT_454815 [Macroventuria anomochaeta]